MKTPFVCSHTGSSHSPQPAMLDMASGSGRSVLTLQGYKAGVALLVLRREPGGLLQT